MNTIKSHRGELGCSVMSANHIDKNGRAWPKGTCYRSKAAGFDSTSNKKYATIIIESSHYNRDVLESGFGAEVTFYFSR